MTWRQLRAGTEAMISSSGQQAAMSEGIVGQQPHKQRQQEHRAASFTASDSPSQTSAADASSSSSSQQPQQQPQPQTPIPPAQVLTRSSLPSLSTLDAGDVIECYALFRRAKLTPTDPTPVAATGSSGSGAAGGGDGRMVDETSSGNDSNTGTTSSSTGTNKHSGGPYGDALVRIQKSALAFRYRPPSWSSLDDAPLTSIPAGYAKKRSYELTLEYGPSRRGSALDQESMPVVVGGLGGGAFGGSGVRYPGDGYAHVAQANGDDSDGSNNNGQQETLYPDERYVTWDNEAKIYYRTEIDEEEWVEAYYVAPISGAVLSKVLDYAVEYAERHRRYQPFEVVGIGGDGEADKEDDSDDGNDGADSNSYGSNCDFGSSCETKRTGPSLDHPKTILRSSSADDFVWSVFDKLASMYVDIRPILAPPRERVRFFVRGVQDVQKLSGIVSAEDLALPGVPIDDDDDNNDDEDNNDTTLGDSAGSGVKGGGRDDEEDEYPSNESGVSGPGRNVASLAADFYTRFYDCANAIRTGDYGKWERTVTPRPTMEPTASPDTVTTDSPTAAENGEDSGADENEEPILHNPAEGAEKEEGDEDGTDDDDNDDIVNDNDGNDDGVDIDDIDAEDPPNRRLKQMKKAKNDQANSTIAAEEPSLTAKAATPETEPVPEPGLTEFESQEVLAAAKEDTIDDGDDNDATDGAYTAGQDDDGQDEEQPQEQIDEASAAEQAAKEALDKANDAAAAISSNTDDEEAVAAAAQEAANAAKKAAEASSLAKAAAGMDAIFSADGGQMTQILATCLNDPKYEIRVDRKVALPSPSPVDDREMEDGSSPDAPEHRYATVSTTHVFLYIDGTSYYRLNLTPPFWDASPAIQNMPQPKLYEEGQAQILDSLFFFGIIGAFVFGMVVLLHNIGVLRIDPRLKFKSFFHPPHPGPAGGTRGGYMNATQVRESGGYRDEVDVDSDSCFTDEASDAADWKNGSDEPRPTRGGGQVHPFNNPSAIPTIFMGKSSSTQNLQVGAAAATAAADSWEGDFELSDMKGTDSRQGSESCRSSSNRSGADLDFGQSGAMGSRIDNMKAAMDDDDNDENDDSAGKTPKGRGRSRSFRRDDLNRSVHSASSSSNRRRRSPVDSVPLPAQVRASRDPEFVDLPGLKSLTPVAIPQGISRQSSRASASKSKRSLSGELQQESVVDDGHENSDFGGSSNGSTPLAIV